MISIALKAVIAVEAPFQDDQKMPNRPHNADHAVIHLDGDQALLLFEYLWESLSGDGRPVEQTAEIAVLNHVLCQLEEQLVAPFRDDYADLLSSARARLKPAG